MLRPRYWGIHLFAVVCVGIAFWFGNWQLDSWNHQRESEAVDLTKVTPIPLDDALGPDQPFPADMVGQPVLVKGTWLPESTVLVGNRSKSAKGGHWVVTPLAIGEPDAPALMIVRGWTTDVEHVPEAPTGEAEFVVNLQPGEGTGAVDDDPTDNVLPQLRIADALNHVDRDLYGGYGVVTTEIEGDFPVGDAAVNAGTDDLRAAELDQLPKTKGSTALRNLLYAIEWWVFGLFAAYIWWVWVRDELKKRESQITADEGPEPPPIDG